MPIKNISSQGVIQPGADPNNLVNQVITKAVEEGASDIHIEPKKSGLIVRYRIDGILKVMFEIPGKIVQPLISRIKIMADLDTTGLPRPLEGSIKFEYENRDIDLRVSIFPTCYGECVVMRILESVKQYKTYENLGFFTEQAELVEQAVAMPYGLILVTGPTGSGKSTTLFTMLDKLNEPGRSLATLEDPIERKLEHVRQTQIDPKVNLTFASGLHYLLRQDSDIIMVGEIRDKETAQIAVQAAITGQLVLATIHTNNAAGAIVRLVNMKVEPFLIATALKLVTAQRLVRINCPYCREQDYPSREILAKVQAPEGMEFFKSKGCPKCNYKGVVGRIGIHETLSIVDEIKELIYTNPSDDHITHLARKMGMHTLRDAALQKAEEGAISIEEVLRVTE